MTTELWKTLAKAVRFREFRLLARAIGRPYIPPKGRAVLGDLRRLLPISQFYGYDRGRPIDRYYIEKFLQTESASIRGRVLEMGSSVYTNKFGGTSVAKSDILHISEGHPLATIVGDLSNAPHLPSAAFDCVIMTQTLQFIFDVDAALKTTYRILKPGGVLLATFPGLSQLADPEWNDTWYWGFTTLSARKLFESAFPRSVLEIKTHGNVLSTIAFLHGLCDEELTAEELDYMDARYQLLITAKALKSVG